MGEWSPSNACFFGLGGGIASSGLVANSLPGRGTRDEWFGVAPVLNARETPSARREHLVVSVVPAATLGFDWR